MLIQIWSHLETAQQPEVETYTIWEYTEEERQHVKDFLRSLLQMIPSFLAELAIVWSTNKLNKSLPQGEKYVLRSNMSLITKNSIRLEGEDSRQGFYLQSFQSVINCSSTYSIHRIFFNAEAEISIL